MARQILYTFFLLLILAVQGCRSNKGLPDLRETYGYRETKPFGTSIAYQLLQKSFPGQDIQVKKSKLYETIGWTSDTGSLYMNISNKFFIENEDANALMDFVYKGNTAFIAASEIDTVLLDKLYCAQKSLDKIYVYSSMPYTKTHVKLVPAVMSVADTMHQYFYLPFINYFSQLNGIYSRVVGYDQVNRPNFIVFFWGRGRLYLHCDPRAFSNYFLLQKNNYQYLMQPLSVLPAEPEHIFWDDHYNKKNYRSSEGNGSLSKSIFKNPPLIWAFWIVIALLLFYVLVNSKRKQRVIPVVKPVQNSSVAFAEAIAGLYLKEKNNKTITEKMVTYFNEYIRTRYFLNTNNVNNDFLLSLSKKAAVPLDKTETLYRTFEQLSTIREVTDHQLLNLNEQIQQFNKYKS